MFEIKKGFVDTLKLYNKFGDLDQIEIFNKFLVGNNKTFGKEKSTTVTGSHERMFKSILKNIKFRILR